MMRFKDDFRDHCGQCVHYVPWPEVALMHIECRNSANGAPDGCCLANGYHAIAVDSTDSPDCCVTHHERCRFERGTRSKWIKEIRI